MKSIFVEAIERILNTKEYEVTFTARVLAVNVGEAVKLAARKLAEGPITVRDVKEV